MFRVSLQMLLVKFGYDILVKSKEIGGDIVD